LADTKYEFGKIDDVIYLMDEVIRRIAQGIFMLMVLIKRQQNGERQKTVKQRVCT